MSQVMEGDVGEVVLNEALVGLPAEVKVIGSKTDNVVPLEELAMRTLHRLYRHHPAGEDMLLTRSARSKLASGVVVESPS